VTSLSEELGRDVPVAEVLPLVESRLEQLLAWAPYDRTPDYAPRPGPRVPVLNPLS
jgi:lipoyl(octanoyl) transferase